MKFCVRVDTACVCVCVCVRGEGGGAGCDHMTLFNLAPQKQKDQ